MRIGSGAAGHPVVVGTAEQVADVMQEWFIKDGCDGFNLEAPYVMAGLDSITDQLIPVLQERGLFRTEEPHFGITSGSTAPVNRPPRPNKHRSN
jgi:N-acetyl-S-(2-succino)cysteine monooxygenase